MGDKAFSLEHIKQELPVFGTGDYRSSAVEISQENGSRISDFQYHSHHVDSGKPLDFQQLIQRMTMKRPHW